MNSEREKSEELLLKSRSRKHKIESGKTSMREKQSDKKRAAAKWTVRKFFECMMYLVIVIALTYVVIRFVGQRTGVSGSSMEPALSDGDHLLIDKLSYRFHEPERFDVVVFPDENTNSKYYIKRVIGLPGERVQIDEKGYIYVNGEELCESYGLEVIKEAEEIIDLGEDEYYVLGDNRNNSEDSRGDVVGRVHRYEIVGKAWFRIYPINRIGFVKHG
jgi:signal peptidase I